MEYLKTFQNNYFLAVSLDSIYSNLSDTGVKISFKAVDYLEVNMNEEINLISSFSSKINLLVKNNLTQKQRENNKNRVQFILKSNLETA